LDALALAFGFASFYAYLNLAGARAFKGETDQAKAALTEAGRTNPKLSVK